MKKEAPKPRTILAQADHYIDATTRAVTPPLIAASTLARDADYAPRLSGVTCSRENILATNGDKHATELALRVFTNRATGLSCRHRRI